MKLGKTAAKRVNGSVKCAKPAQHGCGHARGDEPGGRSGKKEKLLQELGSHQVKGDGGVELA